MRILIPYGTRPEVVKLSPLIVALRRGGHDVIVVFTGQQTSPEMIDAIEAELGVTTDIRWTVDGTAAERAGIQLTQAFDVIALMRPDLIVVLGDTSTVPTFTLAARRSLVPVAHVEAGLRSFNERSPEEVHRRMAAAIATVHFAPTDLAASFLRAEGVADERIWVVGNTAIDVLVTSGWKKVPLADRSGVLVTAHRPGNVDDGPRLTRLVALVRALAESVGPVLFPVHPRTLDRVAAFGLQRALEHPLVSCVPPVTQTALLSALSHAKVTVTDSGGIQEEAAFFGVPAVVLRRSTPRWEGVMAGSTVLAGLDDDSALHAATFLATADEQRRVDALACPYGDGVTAARIAAAIDDAKSRGLLELREPDLRSGPPGRVVALMAKVGS